MGTGAIVPHLAVTLVAGGRGYPRSASISRKGFEIVRDFTAENVSPSVRDVTHEKAVWPTAQEK